MFFLFYAAHSPVRLDIETKLPYFLFFTWLAIIRNQEEINSQILSYINITVVVTALVVKITF